MIHPEDELIVPRFPLPAVIEVGRFTLRESHDLRDRKGRKWSWVSVRFTIEYAASALRYSTAFIACAEYSSSAATGWDLPLEWQFPRRITWATC